MYIISSKIARYIYMYIPWKFPEGSMCCLFLNIISEENGALEDERDTGREREEEVLWHFTGE